MSSDPPRPQPHDSPSNPPAQPADEGVTVPPGRYAADSGGTEPLPPVNDSNAPTLGPVDPPSGSDRSMVPLEIPPDLVNHPRYRVLRLLGQGGMGAVYLAEHVMMNRKVALKIINTQLLNSADAIQRFHREIQASARLSHVNIVSAYDAEQAGSIHFLVMEYIEGETLADILKRHGKMAVTTACELIRQAAIGLQRAHEQGTIHRDIKPHNLMRTRDGTVKILDFGLARFASEQQSPASSQTASGVIMGTADYIAPEQTRGGRAVDIRADIYSLGCTLYHLLSGDVPFPEGTVVDKMIRQAMDPPKPLLSLRPDLPPGLEAVVMRMMRKNPDDRYQTPAEVATALEIFAAGKAATAPPPRPARPSRSGEKRSGERVPRADTELLLGERDERRLFRGPPKERPKPAPAMPYVCGSIALVFGGVALLTTPSLLCCFDPAMWYVLGIGGTGLLISLIGVMISVKYERAGLLLNVSAAALNLLAGSLILFVPDDLMERKFGPWTGAGPNNYPTYAAGTSPQKVTPVLAQNAVGARVEITEARIVPGMAPGKDTLVIRLSITNTSSTKELSFTPWSRVPLDTTGNALPRLRDRNSQVWKWERPNRVGTFMIPPGQTMQEELTFSANTGAPVDLYLSLRMPPLSEGGTNMEFIIPADKVVK